MASSNKNNTMEDNKPSFPITPKELSHLPGCLNKFQEEVNRGRAPSPPPTNSGQNQQKIDYNVLDEMKHVHQLIKANGQYGGYGMEIKFGDLIPLYGTAQINKLIEILAIARKNGYINYTLNDFLRQDRDENIYIRLIKTPF